MRITSKTPAAGCAIDACCGSGAAAEVARDDDHEHSHEGANLELLGLALGLAIAAEAVGFFAPDARIWQGVGLLVAASAIWASGFDVYKKGLIALRHGRLNINALMTVAVTGAFVIGQWPEAAMVMALYAIAEAIEAKAVDRARNTIKGLLAMAPEVAAVRQADGSWLHTPVGSVPLQVVVRVRPGERVPMDGLVTAGSSAINQAPVTGESIPVDKAVGDAVFAGTINQTGTIEIQVTAAASNSTLARIIHAVEEAQGTRAPTQGFVERFAAIYTPGVFIFALVVALLGPWLFDWTWLQATYKALVLLVIACPCALVISTPVTVVSGLAAAARRGILIKGGVYLEDARKLKAIALDKTGTITEGKPRLVSWEPLAADAGRGLAESLAAALAGQSDHPVSFAIARGLAAPTLAVEHHAGAGHQGGVSGAGAERPRQHVDGGVRRHGCEPAGGGQWFAAAAGPHAGLTTHKPTMKTNDRDRLLQPSSILDYEHPLLQTLIIDRGWMLLPERERIGAVYTFVRDEIGFGYNDSDDLPASRVLADRIGQCNTKGTLLMALLRGVGIACRFHGFTIDKALQKGAITGLAYLLAPKDIVHSWVEIWFDGRWVNLEGFILDKAYLRQLQQRFASHRGPFVGYGAATPNLQDPPVDWKGSDTYIQKDGINHDFGVYDTPDAFYAKHGMNLSGVKRWLFQNLVRDWMNSNVQSIRGGA